MKIEKPLNGQVFKISETVAFTGTAGPGVARVQLVADGQFSLGDAALSAGHWTFSRSFSGAGKRGIEAQGFDAAGQRLAAETDAVGIELGVSQLNGYQPPAASLNRLGGVLQQLTVATRIDQVFTKGGKQIFKLSGGQIYYDSLLDLDTDGSKFAAQDGTGQGGTSLSQPNGKPVDANTVPYFVLPGKGFYQQFGIKLGDVAAVVFGDKLEFAVFADNGPRTKLGEGSIALHRSLGHETIRHGKLLDVAIDRDVITIVFPGSGNGTPQTPDKIRAIGRPLFQALGGKVS